MKFSLIKIEQFSGERSTFYTIQLEDGVVLFDEFLEENSKIYEKELKNITQRIRSMANQPGAQEHFFRQKEGKPGDGVCALYDQPKSKLRLYCIRYGNAIVILGGGGRKTTRTLQEDPKLDKENKLMRELSQKITVRVKAGEIDFSVDELEFIGNLEFYD